MKALKPIYPFILLQSGFLIPGLPGALTGSLSFRAFPSTFILAAKPPLSFISISCLWLALRDAIKSFPPQIFYYTDDSNTVEHVIHGRNDLFHP